MNIKKILLPVILLLMLAPALATLTVTINHPFEGQTIYPNMGEPCTVIDFNVVDSNTARSIHEYTIEYDATDSNTTIIRDGNIGVDNCNFLTNDVWSSNGGAQCTVNYCWSVHNPDTGTYTMDLNVSSRGNSDANGSPAFEWKEALVSFRLDNRWISTVVEALINTVPIVLIAAVLVSIVAAMAGFIRPRIVLYLSIGAVISVIAVIILAQIMQVLTP